MTNGKRFPKNNLIKVIIYIIFMQILIVTTIEPQK